MVALEEGLHASGQALIPCAALRPAGAEGLVLIHAASGTGETTTALALAGAGGLWPVQQGRLDLLGALAAQVPYYELRVATGTDGLSAAICAMLSAF